MKVLQKAFDGGMNLLKDGANLGDNEYGLSFNLTNRYGGLIPFKKCATIGLPKNVVASDIQALSSLGNYLVLFAQGKAWTCPIITFSSSIVWKPVGEFNFDSDAERYWTALVPASESNKLRRLKTFSNALDGVIMTPTSHVEGTARGMIVQDGVHQPWFIYEDSDGEFRGRVTGSYDSWTADKPEYVPIGTVMLWWNGKLWMSDPTGVMIYHSVTGRPMDFMIVVDTAGNKLSLEVDGGAAIMAYTVGYDPVTSFYPLSSNELLVGTDRACYAVSYDTSSMPFDEPLITKKYICDSGPINDKAVIDVLGDSVFINYDGIRSFNAVKYNWQEGKNSIFSLTISNLFESVIQSTTRCSAGFTNNYGLFAIDTSLGAQAIMVYDMLGQTWCSIYKPLSITGDIRWFCTVSGVSKRLFIVTTEGLFEAFAGDGYEIAHLTTKDFCPVDLEANAKPTRIRALLSDCVSDGMIWASSFTDGSRCDNNDDPLEKHSQGIAYPANYPISFTDGENVANKSLPFLEGKLGWKSRFTLRWNNGARLICLQGDGDLVSSNQSFNG